MTNIPKISIIIPVYNVELYIPECLQSVMRQTYKGEIECIIVDDCGKDRSVEIAEQLVNTYNGPIEFRILHHEHNRGLSAARNTGTGAATGDYIYYLDSDDYISDDCMDVLSQPLKEYEYDMVIGNISSFGNNNRIISGLTTTTSAIKTNADIIHAFYIDKKIYFMAWNKLIRRDLFLNYDLKFIEGQLEEDELWTYKCCRGLKSLFIQNHTTYYYRLRDNGIMGMSKQNIKKHASSYLISLDYVFSHPLEATPDVWHKIILYYMTPYISLSIQPFENSYKQYRLLRQRIDYRPLKCWRHSEISLADVKHQFHFVLSPFCGYLYLKIRKYKQIIMRKM